ncbi:hypothetical protein CBS147339_8466 [Penicillium roqueforti]|nr:hypothetical protein CBS147339_8466 [Penicillium roqueforti]KAI3129959.1 hypothetical protein CBS147325_9478 [Penicillium roqueforti]KAI3152938.1 hypothetical protein DTO046C5_8858 [Penicillium roqueforti]KAI3180781.1 hypothetical protein DTO032C6_8153 [Penicillium roqueforti]
MGAFHGLGDLYSDQGKLKEAEEMYQRALAGYEKALGPNHTSTLVTVNNLGNLFSDQGKLKEAEEMYQRALDVGHAERHPRNGTAASHRLRCSLTTIKTSGASLQCSLPLSSTTALAAAIFCTDRAAHWPPDFCHIGNEPSAPLPLVSPSIGDPDWLRPRRQAIPLLCWLMSSRGRASPTGRHEMITAVDLLSWVHSPHEDSGWANSALFDGRSPSARWARLHLKSPSVVQWARSDESIGYFSLYPTETALKADVAPYTLNLTYPLGNSSSTFTFALATNPLGQKRDITGFDDVDGLKIEVVGGTVDPIPQISFCGLLGGSCEAIHNFEFWNITFGMPPDSSDVPQVQFTFEQR